MGGERSRFRRIWILVQHELKLQLASGLNHLLGARRVAFAGKFDENFILSAARGRHIRLFQSEAADAATNRFERLIHRLLLNRGNHRWTQSQEKTIRLSSS